MPSRFEASAQSTLCDVPLDNVPIRDRVFVANHIMNGVNVAMNEFITLTKQFDDQLSEDGQRSLLGNIHSVIDFVNLLLDEVFQPDDTGKKLSQSDAFSSMPFSEFESAIFTIFSNKCGMTTDEIIAKLTVEEPHKKLANLKQRFEKLTMH